MSSSWLPVPSRCLIFEPSYQLSLYLSQVSEALDALIAISGRLVPLQTAIIIHKHLQILEGAFMCPLAVWSACKESPCAGQSEEMAWQGVNLTKGVAAIVQQQSHGRTLLTTPLTVNAHESSSPMEWSPAPAPAPAPAPDVVPSKTSPSAVVPGWGALCLCWHAACFPR